MQPETPYRPPRAELAVVEEHAQLIDALAVSVRWKRRFHLIEKAGGVRLPRFRELPTRERMGLNFNVLAFLFGPLYYLAKGMWRKALSLFVVCALAAIALAFALSLLGLEALVRSVPYGVAAIFAVRANIDYYKRQVLGDDGWW